MQIEADQTVCPACGAEGLELFPVLHHMMCAYVGPEYDFLPAAAGYTCPKCRRDIVSGDTACEIVGTSARCIRCRKEMIVFAARRFSLSWRAKARLPSARNPARPRARWRFRASAAA